MVFPSNSSNSQLAVSGADPRPAAKPISVAENAGAEDRIFRQSALIRFTLLAFYLALTMPLPFLAAATAAPVPPLLLAIGLGIGLIVLYGALSEQVIVNQQGIQVTYPTWMRWIWRKGWSLSWTEIQALKPRSTGQGGLVYYFLSQSGTAYLLPMRIAGFAELVRRVQSETNIDTQDVRPLAQPWMYLILLLLTILLLAIDAWTITIALGQSSIV